MYNRYQTLLFLTFIDKYYTNTLLKWVIKRKRRNTSSRKRTYIKKKVDKAEKPDNPLKILIVFLKITKKRSSTLGEILDQNQGLWDGEKEGTDLLNKSLSQLELPTICVF